MFFSIVPPAMRIYTCTPVSFAADRGFFIRDTGLICRHLREMGADSRAVMPLPTHAEDEPDGPQLRVPYEQLESAEWWRAQRLDGVVLYSWAAPRYTPVARAIHEAGIRLVVHLDATEDFRPVLPNRQTPLHRLIDTLKELVQMPRRRRHLAYADAVTMSAATAEKLRESGKLGRRIMQKVVTMPCPVSKNKTYDGTPKENLLVAVGRWDDVWQKRPEMLMQTLETFFARPDGPADARAEIYGTLTDALHRWHAALPAAVQGRVRLCGYVDNDELTTAFRRARICLCTSRFESSHIVSAEAVCCGCAVVTPPRAGQLTVVQGYTVHDSGTIATADTPQALADALVTEFAAWREARRDPAAIAAAWQPVLHADRVMRTLFSFPE